VNRKLENFEAAIIDYTNELTYSSNQNMKALNNRAYCFAKLGKYEQAITDYTRVLNIDPNNIHALHNRGISHERLA
jgi:tetratricopeptide (TPR) repeat protein